MTSLAPDAAARGRPWLAFAWMMLAIAAFTLMAVAGRAAQAELNSLQLMALRSILSVAIIALILWRTTPGFAQIRSRQPMLHVWRNLFHFIGQNAWLVALMMIPLAELTALEFTNPIWVAALAPLFLGERFTRRKLLALALGFAGVLIVARPGLAPVHPGHAIALLAALGFALTTIWTKRIMAHDTVLCVLFWMSASQAVLGLVLGLPGGFPMPSAQVWPWVVVVALTGLVAHYALTSALGLAPASVVAPMDYLRLPVIAAVGMFVYDEPLVLAVFIGGGVILLANLVNIGVRRGR